jgi:hypothetical protein
MLGELSNAYPEAFYVHLKRDPEKVARSFLKRWYMDPAHRYKSSPRPIKGLVRRFESRPFKPGIIDAYAYSIIGRLDPWDQDARLNVCHSFITTVNANIEEFLTRRESMSIDLEQASTVFPEFWQRIGAQGSYEDAVAEFLVRYNASRPS